MKQPSPLKRFFLRWACILIGLYLVVVVAAMFFENTLVYIGAGNHWKKPGERFEEKLITVGDVSSMSAWWLPKSKGPTNSALVFFCGNGGSASGCGNLANEIQKHLDCGVLLVDYPGYGKNDGNPSEAGCYENAVAGMEWLIRDRQIPVEKIIVMGQSLGGGVAVEMASRYPVRAVVIVSSYTSLPEAARSRFPFLPTKWLMRNRFDSISKIGRIISPVFVAHGTIDRTIPYSQGETLFNAANEPKLFLRMEGKGHNDCLNEELLKSIDQFIKRNP